MANADMIMDYLRNNQPNAYCDDCLSNHLNIRPRQQIYQICTRLFQQGMVERTDAQCAACRSYKKSTSIGSGSSRPLAQTVVQQLSSGHSESDSTLSWKEFENLARTKMGEFFKVPLSERQLIGFPKRFDMVALDGSIIGDAKYLTLVRGENLPPAKYMEIAGHVWLLERVSTNRRFLVFGNQREVPEGWLKKYGKLVSNVEFYFLDKAGKLERLL